MSLLETVKNIGDDIARSGMFTCKNEHQGRVIALSCLTTGRDILSVPEEYHLMNNRLSLKADAMLARLVKDGGEYEIIEHSPERCAIKLKYKGRVFEEELTWQQAQEEPFVYAGKPSDILEKLADPAKRQSLSLSANYATPRRRMQHLWARVVSDSVRVIAPNLITGTYTPEEVADFSGLTTPDFTATTATIAGEVSPMGVPENVIASTNAANNTPSTVSTDSNAVEPTKPDMGNPTSDPSSSESQIAEINQLVGRLKIPADKIAAAFAKRGAKDAAGLTASQAEEMIASLRSKLGDQPTGVGVHVLNTAGPVTAELESQIRSKIKEVAQQSGDGKKFADSIKDKLTSSGMKLSDMSFADAARLLKSLETMQIEEFFREPLIPYRADGGDVGNESNESPS